MQRKHCRIGDTLEAAEILSSDLEMDSVMRFRSASMLQHAHKEFLSHLEGSQAVHKSLWQSMNGLSMQTTLPSTALQLYI